MLLGKRRALAFREVDVIQIREVLRCWLADDGLRTGADRRLTTVKCWVTRPADTIETEARNDTDQERGTVQRFRASRASGHGPEGFRPLAADANRCWTGPTERRLSPAVLQSCVWCLRAVGGSGSGTRQRSAH